MNHPPPPAVVAPPVPPKDGHDHDLGSHAPHAKPPGSAPRAAVDRRRIRNREGNPAAAGEIPWYIRKNEVHRAMGLEPDLRRKELLYFLFRTGCRISEALLFKGSDINRELGVAQVATRKKKVLTVRTLPLPRHYLDRLLAIAPAGGGPIWPWSRVHAYNVVRRSLERAGVSGGRAHPHSLRHGHAIHAVDNGVPIEMLQRQLGHAQLATTGVYLRATAEDVRREYERIDWMGDRPEPPKPERKPLVWASVTKDARKRRGGR